MGNGTWDTGHGIRDMGYGTWDTGHGHVTSHPMGDSTGRLDPIRLSRFRDRISIPRYYDPYFGILTTLPTYANSIPRIRDGAMRSW
jgi:hypothetical protein